MAGETTGIYIQHNAHTYAAPDPTVWTPQDLAQAMQSIVATYNLQKGQPRRPIHRAGRHRALQECNPSFINAGTTSSMYTHVCSTRSRSVDHSGPISGNAEYKFICAWWRPIMLPQVIIYFLFLIHHPHAFSGNGAIKNTMHEYILLSY